MESGYQQTFIKGNSEISMWAPLEDMSPKIWENFPEVRDFEAEEESGGLKSVRGTLTFGGL